MLAGSRELIDEAWRYKQMWGGALRQAGIVAAGGLYALDHNVERLAEDHENARVLAEGLAELQGIDLDRRRWTEHRRLPRRRCVAVRGLERAGVRCRASGSMVRAVTHLDVDRAGVEKARRSGGGSWS